MKHHIDTKEVAKRCNEARKGVIEIAPKHCGFRTIKHNERSTLEDWESYIEGIVGDVHYGITQHHGDTPNFTYS